MRLFKARHLLALAAVIMIITACRRMPSGVLSRERMTELMADIYRGESVVEFNGNVYYNDSLKKVVKQSILLHHGVTQEELDSSLAWYGRHIEEYVKVCDDAILLLENRLEMIPPDAIAGSLQVAGDSARVWVLPPYYRITSRLPSEFITFRLDSDDEWNKGDVYQLELKIAQALGSVETVIAVDYSDGFSEFNTMTANKPGWIKPVLRLDSTRTATRVYGFINVHPIEGEAVYLDSVSLLRMRLQPSQYFRRMNQYHLQLYPDSINND